MIDNNTYLLELLTDDLPTTKLNDILNKLKCVMLNNLQKNNIRIMNLKSFITIRRISFIFDIDKYINLDLHNIVKDIFENTKFHTNMRWGFNKKSFIRPIKSYILMCNTNLIQHKLFDIESVNYTLIDNKHIYVTPFNYYNLVRYNYNIICDVTERLTILNKKICIYLNKYKCDVLLDNKILIDTANSFEYPCIDVVAFDNIWFKMPMRIIIITLLSYGCISLIINSTIIYLLIIIDSYKKKRVGQLYALAIKNKLLDIEAMRNADKLILNNISTTILKSIILDKNLDTVYSKIKRLFKLLNYIAVVLYIKVSYIKKSIILLNMEIFSKFIFENNCLTGLLFVDSYHKKEVTDILYNYNKIFNNYIPTDLHSSILIIIENIENVVTLYLNNNNPKGRNDPYNFKKKVILTITCILERQLNINLIDLIKLVLNNFTYIRNDIFKIFDFFIDKLKFHFKCKYTDIIKHTPNLYKVFKISNSIDFFCQYKIKDDFICLIKRIENITSKHKITFLKKINKNLLLTIDEHILFNKLSKLIAISALLLKNKMYFEKLKFDLSIQNKINNFFKNVLIICQNNNIKNNRLKLLHVIKYMLNRVVIFNIKNLEMLN